MRAASAVSTSTSRRSGRAAAAVAATAAGTSSTSVPNASQPGHLPNQRPAEYPHSVHANCTAAFAFAT
jgi:hypothetical protein